MSLAKRAGPYSEGRPVHSGTMLLAAVIAVSTAHFVLKSLIAAYRELPETPGL